MDLNHLNLRVRDAAACRDFYARHFGFRPSFEAAGGFFLENDDGFVLALIPASVHQPLPDGFHIGFRLDTVAEVERHHEMLGAGGVEVSAIEDFRPGEAYVTFRCTDPDDTEIEVLWSDE